MAEPFNGVQLWFEDLPIANDRRRISASRQPKFSLQRYLRAGSSGERITVWPADFFVCVFQLLCTLMAQSRLRHRIGPGNFRQRRTGYLICLASLGRFRQSRGQSFHHGNLSSLCADLDVLSHPSRGANVVLFESTPQA